jgi:hypothetical protein
MVNFLYSFISMLQPRTHELEIMRKMSDGILKNELRTKNSPQIAHRKILYNY